MDVPRFDVFLSHNSRDKPAVERLAVKLKTAGLEPWLDKWCLTPGGRWQEELVAGLRACSTCAVFVGPNGIGDWVHEELGVALDRAAKDRSFRLFLVLLPGLPEPFDSTMLPPFLSTRTWVDLRSGIEDSRAFQHLVNAIKGVPFGQQVQAEHREDICPYRGLQTFDQDHAQFFFGRDNDVQRLVEKLKSSHFLAVLGPSGSGKSSLVRAGLVPALNKGALSGSHDWATCVFTPGAHPLTTLAAQLVRLYERASMHRALDEMAADARTMHLSVALALADLPPSDRVVWVVDQFEEIFTLCTDEHERSQFLANLLYAASVPDGRCIVLVTLRADFYPKCAAYPDLSARIAAQQFLVSPLDHVGLRRAIVEPAWLVGLEFEEGLVDTILDDVASQPGALPLLEHALLELWERRRGSMLTLEAYRESGGVHGAIAKRADTIYSQLSVGEQAIARRALLRLTQPGEGTEDTRRRASLDELVTSTESAGSVDAVVHALVAARLLTTSEDEPTQRHMVEVSHEALIRGWPQLRAWIDEDRSGLLVQRRLTEAALDWQRLDRDESALYRGARLATAVEWQSQHLDSLNELERAFLDASLSLRRTEQTREQERQQRELEAARRLAESERKQADAERKRARVARLFSLGLGVLVVGMVFATIVAIQRTNQAQSAEKSARAAQLLAEQRRSQAQAAGNLATSRELAANSLAQLGNDPQLSLLLAEAADRTAVTSEATSALQLAVSEPYPRVVLRGHKGLLFQAVYSPDGRFVATAGYDHTARIFDARNGRALAVLTGHTGYVVTVAFSHNGAYLVTGSADNTARVWQVPSGHLVAVLRGHKGAVIAVSFSPDDSRVLTGSYDNTARLWDAKTGRVLLVFSGHTYPVWSAAFSPDGRYVATASADYTARIWDARTGRTLSVLSGHKDIVDGVAFSADSRYLATASWDSTARVWSVPNGRLKAIIAGHTDSHVNSVTYSPDGRYVLTAGAEGAALVSNAATGEMVSYLFAGQTTVMWSAAFSRDGRLVVTASADGTARVWTTLGGYDLSVLRSTGGDVYGAAFDSDGQAVLTANRDGTARIWDFNAGTLLASFSPASGLSMAAYSPDGSQIVAVTRDATAHILDARDGHAITVLTGQGGHIKHAAYSADGSILATASDDGSTWLWSTRTWLRIAVLGDHKAQVNELAFSSDSRFLASAGGDGSVVVWQAPSWKAVANLHGFQGLSQGELFTATALTFSPNSRTLAVLANGGLSSHLLIVFSTVDWHKVKQVTSSSSTAWTAAFSPDGRYLATASNDSAVRVWDTQSWEVVSSLKGHTGFVSDAVFSPDGRWLVSAGVDDTVRLWSVGDWRQEAVLVGHSASVYSAMFSPDGKSVLSAGVDNQLRIHVCEICGSTSQLLAVAASHQYRGLTPEERKLYLHE